jgi:hypothetical protein
MSNIPSSAMPHAWAPDHEEEQRDVRSETDVSLRSIVIAGAAGALLLYWMLRR